VGYCIVVTRKGWRSSRPQGIERGVVEPQERLGAVAELKTQNCESRVRESLLHLIF